MKKREIFIELTSLLDVILIMIFVILTQARGQTAQAMDQAASDKAQLQEAQEQLKEALSDKEALRQAAEAEKESLQQEAEALEEQLGEMERRLISQGLVMENSIVITVSVGADAAIRVEREDKERVLIRYDWGDETYAANRLRSQLTEQLNTVGWETVFLVFQYDRSQIYYAEYELIERAIRELKLEAKERDIPFSLIEMDLFS
ncbi:MAG: DUF5320 domain-containing protein [Lachnospiraceae bacterium]|nr:DUF5320 domain-containing protein [Lachnospiraceae bacterium]